MGGPMDGKTVMVRNGCRNLVMPIPCETIRVFKSDDMYASSSPMKRAYYEIGLHDIASPYTRKFYWKGTS